MNFAYYKKLDLILNTNFFEKYEQITNSDVDEILFSYIKYSDGGLAEDILLVNKWSNLLEVKEWFCWDDFKNIPANYEEQPFLT